MLYLAALSQLLLFQPIYQTLFLLMLWSLINILILDHLTMFLTTETKIEETHTMTTSQLMMIVIRLFLTMTTLESEILSAMFQIVNLNAKSVHNSLISFKQTTFVKFQIIELMLKRTDSLTLIYKIKLKIYKIIKINLFPRISMTSTRESKIIEAKLIITSNTKVIMKINAKDIETMLALWKAKLMVLEMDMKTLEEELTNNKEILEISKTKLLTLKENYKD